jgi:hypothetical protein
MLPVAAVTNSADCYRYGLDAREKAIAPLVASGTPADVPDVCFPFLANLELLKHAIIRNLLSLLVSPLTSLRSSPNVIDERLCSLKTLCAPTENGRE